VQETPLFFFLFVPYNYFILNIIRYILFYLYFCM
jgi:hypothetical protein